MRGLAAYEGGVAWRLETYTQVPSTSELCAARARAGEPEGLAVLAAQQTKGRGRGDRLWLSPPGNLAISVLLRPQTPLAMAGRWALLAGVALHMALVETAPAAALDLRLKWPNDVMLAGAKLGGILIDASADARGCSEWLVIGFGVNLLAAPDVAGRQVAALSLHVAMPPTAPDLARALLFHLSHGRTGLHDDDGFARLRAAWLERAHPIGTALTVRQGSGACQGYFVGLDDTGALLLETEGGIRKIQTGEAMLAGAA